jgi:TrmH family RNA methyltransferase
MTTITSPQNPQLKELRKLMTRRDARGRAGLFVAEGEDLIAAAREAGWPAQSGYRAAGVDVGEPGFHEVDPLVLGRLSTLGSGTRAIGVYRERWAPTATGPACLHLHGVRDPGNVGTIVRSAYALGASEVSLGPGCADPFGPRAVRASMGAVFHVPLARASETLPGERIALAAGRGEPLHGPATQPFTLIVGAERDGLPRKLVEAADRVAHLPMRAGDSLNAAMAATVALYELTRDRIPD